MKLIASSATMGLVLGLPMPPPGEMARMQDLIRDIFRSHSRQMPGKIVLGPFHLFGDHQILNAHELLALAVKAPPPLIYFFCRHLHTNPIHAPWREAQLEMYLYYLAVGVQFCACQQKDAITDVL